MCETAFTPWQKVMTNLYVMTTGMTKVMTKVMTNVMTNVGDEDAFRSALHEVTAIAIHGLGYNVQPTEPSYSCHYAQYASATEKYNLNGNIINCSNKSNADLDVGCD